MRGRPFSSRRGNLTITSSGQRCPLIMISTGGDWGACTATRTALPERSHLRVAGNDSAIGSDDGPGRYHPATNSRTPPRPSTAASSSGADAWPCPPRRLDCQLSLRTRTYRFKRDVSRVGSAQYRSPPQALTRPAQQTLQLRIRFHFRIPRRGRSRGTRLTDAGSRSANETTKRPRWSIGAYRSAGSSKWVRSHRDGILSYARYQHGNAQHRLRSNTNNACIIGLCFN